MKAFSVIGKEDGVILNRFLSAVNLKECERVAVSRGGKVEQVLRHRGARSLRRLRRRRHGDRVSHRHARQWRASLIRLRVWFLRSAHS